MSTPAGIDALLTYFVTFNCGRKEIDVDYFAAHFFRGQAAAAPLPDLIVLSLQETAPISYSFLGNGLLLPYFSRFVVAVNKAAGHQNAYKHLTTRNVGMTSIMILAKSPVAPMILPVQFAGVGVGHWEMGNKGAVGVRLLVQRPAPVYLTLVAAHLAPMETAWERRNLDWENIVRGLVFTSSAKSEPPRPKPNGLAESEPLLAQQQAALTLSDNGMFDSHSIVIFGGDLNYRTSDSEPSPTQYQEFPTPEEYQIDIHGSAQESGSLLKLKQADQLKRERLAGSTLHRLGELPIAFPPTYKYSESGGLDWPSNGSEPDKWPWSKHRFPSWCDRILLSEGLIEAPFTGHSYRALPLQPTSDHRPVALSFSLDLSALSARADILAPVRSPFPLNPHWKVQRANARRLEILVGSIAYLTTTREGYALLGAAALGAVGGWYLIQSMIAS